MVISMMRLVGGCLVFALLIARPAPGQGKSEPGKPAWNSLFDGKSLDGWKEAKFGGEGDVAIEGGALIMERGNDMTGVAYAKNDFPKINYEVVFQGKKIKGNDFFCTTTFPVDDSFCSLVVGGWAGTVVGLSSIDGLDANRNNTKTLQEFKRDQWYQFRIRVTKERIQAWIDDKSVVDLGTKGKKISIRAECDLCRPFGFCTWNTVGAVKDIRVRTLTEKELADPKKEPEKKPRQKNAIGSHNASKALNGLAPRALKMVNRLAD